MKIFLFFYVFVNKIHCQNITHIEVNMKLSVCMIVKNEHDVLARILTQVQKFADEIVIVDTGSTDDTVDIAKTFTHKVYNFDWCDHFGKARNYSFSKATYEYIMWLDADDFIEDIDVQKILALKASDSKYDIYMLKYAIAFDDNQNPTFEYFRERIVKNSPRFRWRGFVHECIALSGKISYTDIVIKHKKVNPTPKGRNLDIYKKHIAKGYMLNARETFYYARELYFNNFISESKAQFEKFLQMPNAYTPNIIDAHLMLARIHIQNGDYTRAKNVLIDSMKICPPNSQICCVLAFVAEHDKDNNGAIFWYKSATHNPPNFKSGAFVERDYSDFIPYVSLSVLYYKLGDHDMFCHYHNLAKTLKPDDPIILQNKKYTTKKV